MFLAISILTLAVSFGLYVWNRKQCEKLRENRVFIRKSE